MSPYEVAPEAVNGEKTRAENTLGPAGPRISGARSGDRVVPGRRVAGWPSAVARTAVGQAPFAGELHPPRGRRRPPTCGFANA